MAKRLSKKLREAQLIQAAILAASVSGIDSVTKQQIAELAGVTHGLVSRYLGNMADVRRTIVREAISQEVTAVILNALSTGRAQMDVLPPGLQTKVLDYMQGGA